MSKRKLSLNDLLVLSLKGIQRKSATSFSFERLTHAPTFRDVDPRTVEAIVEAPERYYYSFKKLKKSGSERQIDAPHPIIAQLHQLLLAHFYKCYRIPQFLHGSLPRRSPKTHAANHVGKRLVATYDAKDFFPNTRIENVIRVLEVAGFRGKAIDDVASIVMLRDGLPQGAATSPFLANYSFLGVDRQFLKLCRKWGLDYSRFVDDIAISGREDFRFLKGPFRNLIRQAGFEIPDEKENFYGQHKRQIVTGLVVNEKLRPSQGYISQVSELIRVALVEGVWAATACEGLSSPGRFKAMINGRVQYIRQHDAGIGNKLKRKLNGIDWHPDQAQDFVSETGLEPT